MSWQYLKLTPGKCKKLPMLRLSDVQVVLLLLEHNVQIDPQDSLGNTPLHLACSNGHMETTALLLMVSYS